jgi:hypothetical protein
MQPPRRDSQFWPFLYWLTGLLALVVILWITATDFDHTEGAAICGTGAASAVTCYIIDTLRRKVGRDE